MDSNSRSHHVFTTVVIPVMSLLVAGGSLWVGYYALQSAEATRKDSRAVSGLDVEPQVVLRADLQERKVGDGTRPPNFVIANRGPVPAIQTTVELIYHEYDPSAKQFGFSFSGTGDQFFEVGTLEPLEVEAFLLSKSFLDYPVQARDAVEGYPVLELRIKYRRDADKKLYIARAIYFFNSEGRWVKENDVSLVADPVHKEVVAYFDKRYYNSEILGLSDKLHIADFNELDTYPQAPQ